LDKLEDCLHKIYLSKKKCLILGDININTLCKNKLSKDYLNLIHSEGFNPLIFEATRITETTRSCIDHIHTNYSISSTSGSIAFEVADHLPVFSIIYDSKGNPFPDVIEFRDFKKFNVKRFRDDLHKESWSSIYNCKDTNECINKFTHIFNNVSNKHAPIKTFKLKNSTHKPWVTSGLKKSIKVRNKIYKEWLITHNMFYLNKYKLYRNKIDFINKRYRDMYYANIMSESKNAKKMWDNINLVINKKRSSTHIDKIKHNDKEYQHSQSISQTLNDYFCNISHSLSSLLPKSNRSYLSYLTNHYKTFSFDKISEVEVFLLLDNLDTKKSFGPDYMHPRLVAAAALEIFRPLTYIINLSILNGVFPDSLKVAKVIPVFKAGSKFLCNNYRPISILPVLSKIFEKCIYNQIIFHLSVENILVPNQYGFRKGLTTTDCLVDLLEEITSALDNSQFVISIFLDLTKAFDTVNHSILLNKLSYYGLKDKANLWFKSYLSNRKQKVFVNGVFSNLNAINTGVPQGSILGPLLFLVYINDFVNVTNFFSIRLFADDTSLTASNDNLDTLISNINSELPRVFDWLCANKLTLNLTKTKYIIFQPKQRLNYNINLPLILNNQYLDNSSSVTYLGVIIDSHLSWHNHIDYVCSKVSKNINIITKLKHYFGKEILINTYYSLIYPFLTYNCILWGNTYVSSLDKLNKLQNKLVRKINNVPLYEHITPHFTNLKLLKFPDLVKLFTCSFLYDLLCDNKPHNFVIPMISEHHNYSTRSACSNFLAIPKFRTNIRKFCPTIRGRYFWNELPLTIKTISNKVVFKKSLKTYLFSKY